MHSTTIPRILVTLVSILVTVSLFQGVASLAKPTVDGTEQRIARAAGPAAEARLAARMPAPSAETAVAAMKPTTSGVVAAALR
jgi:hypothetical protein